MEGSLQSDARADPIVVCCAIDENYALPFAVALRSAEENLAPGSRLSVYVIAAQVPEKTRGKIDASLTGRTTIEWLEPDRALFEGLPLWGHFPPSTYDRLLIAQRLSPGIGKAIWLDVDTLVLGDLGELWRMDLRGNHLLAVRDALVPSVGSPYGVAAFRELGMEPHEAYFNAGVMLMDLDLWRRDRVDAAALRYLKQFGRLVFFLDQEALNVSLYGKWGPLDERWNWSLTAARTEFANRQGFGDDGSEGSVKGPGVVHFTGMLKPWNHRDRIRHHIAYFDYLDRTAWAGWRPPRSMRGMALRAYESSGVRPHLLAAELWLMRLRRSATFRHIQR